MNKPLPERPDLDQLRKQAKELQKAFRVGQPEAIVRVGPVDSVRKLTLLDAQRVIAREYGFPGWARLKAHVDALELGAATIRLFAAAAHGDHAGLTALLAARPTLARETVLACAVLGDLEGLRAWVAKNADDARTRGGICDTEALGYLCLGRLGGGEAARVACADLLLAHGADPNATWKSGDFDGRLPVLYAAVGLNNYPQLARRLLAAGARPDDGESIFHAAEKNHRECLQALFDAGGNIGARDLKWKNTPLYFLLGWAPGAGPAQAVREGLLWLLDHGADPNITAYDHAETPLFPAVRNGWDLDLIRRMLDVGANPSTRRADGKDILSVAVKSGREDVVELLLSRGAVDTSTPAERFLGAVAGAREANARALLAANPAWRHELAGEVTSLLVAAARRGDANVLGLAASLDLDFDQPGDNGGRAIHWAAWHGQLDAVRVLVQRGADLNRRDSSFSAPPLGWCAHGSTNCRSVTGDYGAVAALFLAAGADRPPGGPAGGSAAVHEAFAKYPKPED